MEFTPEFITAQGLSTEQVTALTGVTNDNEATLKQGWDTKANDNAEAILNGAADYIKSQNKITLDRNQSEKMGDYLKRVSDVHFSGTQELLDASILEYKNKVSDFKGDETLKQKVLDGEQANDTLLQKIAKLEPLEGIDTKYNTLQGDYDKLNLNLAISQVKPTFADTVNQYEATAKWNAFIEGIQKDYDIKFVDNKAIAVSKTNVHSQKDLKDLVAADDNLKLLALGRKQTGPNAEQKDFLTVNEVPFKIPKDATSEDKSKAIREYLLTQGIDGTSPKFAAEFRTLNFKIAEGLKKIVTTA